MKKFVLFTLCSSIMAALILLNYLIWDREKRIESYKNIREAHNASVETLGREIKQLNDANREMKNIKIQLEDERKQLKDAIAKLEAEKRTLLSTLQKQRENMEHVKPDINGQPLEADAAQWIELLNRREHEKAVEYQYPAGEQEAERIDNFVKCFQKEEGRVAIQSMALVKDDDTAGDLVLQVSVEAQAPWKGDSQVIALGINYYWIYMQYSRDKQKWCIADLISVAPPASAVVTN